jgi:hypothetical protein
MANTLIGSVNVSPQIVQPGQSVYVDVRDVNGKTYTENDGVLISNQGVAGAACYYQFAAPGTKQLTVRAIKGTIDETSVATVQVAGQSMAFRRTLGTPAQTAMPIIQATLKLGNPYVATFTLGTPTSVMPLIAKQHSQPSAGTAPTASRIAPVAVAEESEFLKALAALPADRVTTFAPQSVAKDGKTSKTAGR